MTDEEYISKLYFFKFSPQQVNQLLKIYVYTKDIGLDLSQISPSIDIEVLRKFGNDLKEKRVSGKQLEILKNAMDDKINIEPYLDSKYSRSYCDTLKTLMIFEKEGAKELEFLRNPDFNTTQIKVLMKIAEEGIDIFDLANPQIEEDKLNIFLYAYQNGHDLREYVDLMEYNSRQLETITDALKKSKQYSQIDINVILNKKYSKKKMTTLVECMTEGLNYSKILACNNDNNLDYIHNALISNCDENILNYFCDETLTTKQLTSASVIIELIEDNGLDFDPSPLFKREVNWALMDAYFASVQLTLNNSTLSDEEKSAHFGFLKQMLESNTSYLKFIEIIIAKKEFADKQLEHLMQLDDEREIHFTRKMYELKNKGLDTNKFLDESITLDERIKLYIDSIKDEEIKPDIKEEKPPKRNLNHLYSGEKYFFQTKNEIVEIGYDEDCSIYDEFSQYIDINSESCGMIFLDENEQRIKDLLEVFFMVKYDEVADTLVTYDILEKRAIEDSIEEYDNNIVYLLLESEETFYADWLDNVKTQLCEAYTDTYVSPFEEYDDLLKYGGPDISNEIITTEFREYNDIYTITLTLEDVREIYGDTSKESIAKAKGYVEQIAEYCKEISEGEILYFKTYDFGGNEIDACYGFVGKYAIDEIESNTGIFINELGKFDDIDECFEAINQINIEEER